jgi:hypothetical protein
MVSVEVPSAEQILLSLKLRHCLYLGVAANFICQKKEVLLDYAVCQYKASDIVDGNFLPSQCPFHPPTQQQCLLSYKHNHTCSQILICHPQLLLGIQKVLKPFCAKLCALHSIGNSSFCYFLQVSLMQD